jgi:catechol 2,3-dioxygenase-like lactoylglutathione lyase family enzyme
MTSEGIPVTGVSELALEFLDVDEAERFYSEALGFPVVERWSGDGPQGRASWVMAGERTRIGLWSPQIGLGGGRGGVHVHYALHIDAQDMDATIARLREHGLEVFEWDHSGYGHGRGRTIYVTDPGGHIVEFWEWDVAEHQAEYRAGESPGSS